MYTIEVNIVSMEDGKPIKDREFKVKLDTRAFGDHDASFLVDYIQRIILTDIEYNKRQ